MLLHIREKDSIHNDQPVFFLEYYNNDFAIYDYMQNMYHH